MKNKVPKKIWGALQKTKTYEVDGIEYKQSQVLDEERKGLKVTYVTDSLPCPAISQNAQDANLFICEGMYGDDEQRGKTHDKFHMVFSDAVKLAKDASVEELWLTHFSPALDEPFEYEEFLKKSFEKGEIGFDRKQKTFYFEN